MITIENRSTDKAKTFNRRTALLVGAVTGTAAVGFVMGSGVSNAASADKFTATKQQPNHFLTGNSAPAAKAALAAKVTYPARWPNLTVGTYQPDESTTGLLDGCTKEALTVRNGDWIVTVPGTIITDTLINGKLIIRAANVQVTNCWIQGPVAPTNSNQALVDCTNLACKNFIIRDSVLAPQKPTYGWNAIAGHDYGAYRVNMYNTVDGARVYNGNTGMKDAATNVIISGCWIHDLTLFSPDPNHKNDNRTHNDGVQIEGGAGTKIIGTRIDGFYATSWTGMVKATSDPTDPAVNVWAAPHVYSASGRCVVCSCIQITPNVGAVTGLVLDRNYFNGGAVGVNAANGSPYAGSRGQLGTFTGNRFDRTQGIQGGGGNKTWTIAYGAKYTLTQSANVYLDNSAAVYVRANQTT